MSTSKMVTLRSCDGGSFEVEEAVALQSQTLKRFIEDNCADIHLPKVTSNILAKVLEYCKKHVSDIPKGDDGKVEDPELQNWDAEFLNVYHDTLLDLILAANYLNIKHLSNLTCQEVADRKTNHGRFQNKKHVSTARTSNLNLMKQCNLLLHRLMKHPYGWVFNAPVDTVQLGIPDYFKIIKHPMDLGTVKSKIAKGEYKSPLGFCADVRLTFSNAMRYNPPGHDVNTMARELRTIFESRWKAIEEKLQPVPLKHDAAKDTVAAISIPPCPGHERLMSDLEKLRLTEDLESMTDLEKHKLAEDLVSITDLPSYLIEFLRKQNARQTADDELEIDLESMTDDTLFTLRKLVDDYMRDQGEDQRKAVPCNMNMSGNEVSYMQPSKGNDAMDEDVDIVTVE